MQNWQTNLHSSNKYGVYKSFKSVIMSETFLGVLEQKYVRDEYCRFKLGISDLCHKNRYNEDDALCPMCKTEPDNEIHFLIKCPAYVSIRQQYIPANDSTASVQEHFKIVMFKKESRVIHSVAKFLYLAFKRRSRSE